MNLTHVKYPWILIKFKKDGSLDIDSGNTAQMPEARLDRALVPIKRHLRSIKAQVIHEANVAKRKAAEAETPPEDADALAAGLAKTVPSA